MATNIAETSLTIDGVTTVVDSGLARVASFDRRPRARPARTRPDQQSLGRSAGRSGGADPARSLLPALVRARTTRPAPVGNPRGPPGRSVRDGPGPPRLGLRRPSPIRLVRGPDNRRSRSRRPPLDHARRGRSPDPGHHAHRPAAPRHSNPSPTRPAVDRRRGGRPGVARSHDRRLAIGKGHRDPELWPSGAARGPCRFRCPDPARSARSSGKGPVRAQPPRPGDRPGRRPPGGASPRRPRSSRKGTDHIIRSPRPGRIHRRRFAPVDPRGLSRPGGPPPRGRRRDWSHGRRARGPA